MVWLWVMSLLSIRRAQYIAAQPRSLTVHAELVLLYILGLEAGPSMTPLVSAFALSGDSTYSELSGYPLRKPGPIAYGRCMSKCYMARCKRSSSSVPLILSKLSGM